MISSFKICPLSWNVCGVLVQLSLRAVVSGTSAHGCARLSEREESDRCAVGLPVTNTHLRVERGCSVAAASSGERGGLRRDGRGRGRGGMETPPARGHRSQGPSSGFTSCRVSSSTIPTASTRARCSSAPPRSSPVSSGCRGSSLCSAPRASSGSWWKRWGLGAGWESGRGPQPPHPGAEPLPTPTLPALRARPRPLASGPSYLQGLWG